MGPIIGSLLLYLQACIWFILGHSMVCNDWITGLWMAHFMRRMAEVLFVHRYTRKGVQSKEKESFVALTFLTACVYYGVAGLMIGFYTPVNVVPSSSLWVVLFVIAESGNAYHHWLLSHHTDRSVALVSGMFKLTRKPHYVFEFLSWIFFAMCFPSIHSFSFALISGGAMWGQV